MPKKVQKPIAPAPTDEYEKNEQDKPISTFPLEPPKPPSGGKVFSSEGIGLFSDAMRDVGLTAGKLASQQTLNILSAAIQAVPPAIADMMKNLPVVRFRVQDCSKMEKKEEKSKAELREEYWQRLGKGHRLDGAKDIRLTPPNFGATTMISGLSDVFIPPPLDDGDTDDVDGTSNFNPNMLLNETPTGDKTRCYVETIRRPGSGEFGEDKCAELLSKPVEPSIPGYSGVTIENFSNDFLAAMSKQYAKT